MKNPETIKLHEIYHNLKNGIIYGHNVTNVRYPYFDINLSYSKTNNVFSWQHYGSSANKATISELRWIITIIFNCTPTEFTEKYTTE